MTKQPLSIKDTKIVQLKIAGKTSKQIAEVVYPDTKTGASIVRQRLQKLTVQDALQASLIRRGITIDRALKPIEKALDAKTKRYEHKAIYNDQGKRIDTEIKVIEEDNIPLQLQGSDRARELLGIGKEAMANSDGVSLTPEELQALAVESDEIELTRLVFRKS